MTPALLRSPNRFALSFGVAAPCVAILLVLCVIKVLVTPMVLGASKDYFPSPRDGRVTPHWAESSAPFIAWNLERAGEAPWYRGVQGLQAYRFYWDRGPGSLLIVRVQRTTRGAKVFWWRSASEFEKDPARSGEHEVSPEDWEAIVRSFDAAHFWTAPAAPLPPTAAHYTPWVLEGVSGDDYRLWAIASPARRDGAAVESMIEAATSMVRAAGQLPVRGRLY